MDNREHVTTILTRKVTPIERHQNLVRDNWSERDDLVRIKEALLFLAESLDTLEYRSHRRQE